MTRDYAFEAEQDQRLARERDLDVSARKLRRGLFWAVVMSIPLWCIIVVIIIGVAHAMVP